jgi:GR25 family glycosyltransferase involved in LPS biosynthesis
LVCKQPGRIKPFIARVDNHMSDLIRLDEYFDQIYCINLQSRPDRLAQFINNYDTLGTTKINIVKAVNGKEIDPGDWEHSLGALGCRLSHLNIYKEAVRNGYERILVLEDDVVISKKFREKLSKLLTCTNNDWDMIYFGGHHYLQPAVFCNEFTKLKNTLSTHAIALNGRSLKKIISKIENDARWVDSVMADLHPEMKVYGFKKAVAWQRDGFSDITETEISYNQKKHHQLMTSAKSFLKKAYYTICNLVKSK